MTLQNNQVLPFTIDLCAVSGRVVRLHHTLDSILNRHNYPYAVSVLLGEFITLGVTMATALKFDGVCTVEARGNGAVSLLVADITASGAIRGYAQVDGDIADYDTIKNTLLRCLMGTGHMMVTVDQVSTGKRYQGIVELNHDCWQQCMVEYFEKSLQVHSVFQVACAKYKHGWVSGCIAVQKMPDPAHNPDTETANENWNRAVILLNSITDTELTATHISPQDILTRLYHQQTVRVYTPTMLHDTCRCSRQKMLDAIAQIPESERGGLLNSHGDVSVHCEYCATTQTFRPADIGMVQH